MDNNQNNINNVNNGNGVNPNVVNPNTTNYNANPSVNTNVNPSINPSPSTNTVGVSPNLVNPTSTQATSPIQPGVKGVNPPQPSVPNNVEVLDNSNTNTTPNSNGTENNNGTAKQMKEVEINYTPPSKFKVFLLITFFVVLIAFVIFLPEINSFMESYKAKKEAGPPQVITTGQLVCTNSRSTNNLDISYEYIFHFTDSKLNSLNFTTTTRGDASLDVTTLDEEQAKCDLLRRDTELLKGINIACEYKQGQQETIQNFTFAEIDLEELDAAYSEAGGVLPEFENEENIDNIEKNMNAANYTCDRRSN